jgi:biofilm PGA synthesis protein PgaA
VWWYSNPIDQQYRAFFHTSSHTGTFEEGKGQIDRYGVGVEQRDHINNVAFRNTVEINSSYSSDTDLGLALTTEWQLDDRWSVEGAAETFSSQLPVRAYNAGITAHSLESGVKYRVDEGEYYRTGLTYVDFSDGNQRWMFGAQGYQVVWSNPHHQWALLETVYASSNSKNNTIYFNPSNDLDVGLAAEYQGIIRRRYDFEFRHTLLVGLGAYSQNGFGTDPTAQVTYRHNWKRDKELEWFYGVGMNYHSYDGERELRSTAFGGFTWRFD